MNVPDCWSPPLEILDDDEEVPYLDSRIFGHMTVRKGSSVPVCLETHAWSDTSPHLIILNCSVSSHRPFDVIIPAKVVGGLLVWLAKQAKLPRHPWWKVRFWLHRTEDDVWVWFLDDSPEALSFLPWRRGEAAEITEKVMDS